MGSPGRVHGVSADLDRSPSAPLPPCLLDVRRPLEEQNKPGNRGFALDDPMCPENRSRRAPVILKPPRGPSCTSGPAACPEAESQGCSVSFIADHLRLAGSSRTLAWGARLGGEAPRTRVTSSQERARPEASQVHHRVIPLHTQKIQVIYFKTA